MKALLVEKSNEKTRLNEVMDKENKQKRRRGLILTREGWQKLQNAKLEREFQENHSSRFTLEELSDRAGMTPVTFRKILNREVGVDKQTLVRLFMAFDLELDKSDYTKPSSDLVTQKNSTTPKRIDLGQAVCVSTFYGRTEELNTLQQWLIQDRCRVVALLGMGGIGKTCLAVKLIQEIQENFEYVIWRSLHNAPPLFNLLANLIQFISNEQVSETELPQSVEGRISWLINYLQKYRCLIILDNAETIMKGGVYAGCYLESYEDYGQLIKHLGEIPHQSTLIITSREKPREMASLEGQAIPVRSLHLNGLEAIAGPKIFEVKGLTGFESELTTVVERYAGNALALKIVATMINDVFNGNVCEFLNQDATVFGDISHLLDQQFSRLSNLEKDIIYWLVINREPVSLSELREDIASPIPVQKLLEALESLARRYLIDKATPTLIQKSAALFTLQPVVMEYVTQQMIDRVCEEIETENLDLLRSHALMKATAKDYVRETQIRLFVKPVIDELLTVFRSTRGIEKKLTQIIAKLREVSPLEQSYTAGNILNLFCYLQTDINGYDFSYLTVWQADLRNVKLHNVNFAHGDLAKCLFTETFGGIFSVAFSPDGKLLATGDTNGEVRLYKVADGQQLFICNSHKGWIWSVAFSPNGQILASGSNDQTVKLWDVNTGDCITTLEGHSSGIWSVVFSPDGQILASGSEDQCVKLWNVNTNQCINTLRQEGNRVWSVAFSCDGKTLATGNDDRTIKLWDVSTGQCLKILRGHTHLVRAVSFGYDGQILASASHDKTVKLWDIITGRCLQTLQDHQDRVHSVAFSPDRSILASSSDDRTIKLWEISTGQCIKTLPVNDSNGVWSIAFSPDGQILVSGNDNQTVMLWNVINGRCVKVLQGYCNGMRSVAFTPDGQIVASGSNDQTIKLWDVSSGFCLKTLQEHSSRVTSVNFSSDGQILASGSNDKTIKLWDVKNGRCLKTLHGNFGRVTGVTFSPDNRVLANASYDQTIKLWDVSSGVCLKTLQGHTHRVWSIVFSPDGQILASASHDKTVKLWNVDTGQCLRTLEGHSDWVYSVAFSTDGYTLVSGGSDRTIKFWDVKTGICLKTLQGHASGVYAIAFNTDGSILASGSGDRTIKLWDIKTSTCIKTFSGHAKLIWSVAFSPDNRTLVSGSEDETIKFWNVLTGECLKTLKSPRPYQDIDISHVIGLTDATIATLKALGAFHLDSVATKKS